MGKVKFRIMSHQGDEVKTYTREDAIEEFAMLNKTMTPMLIGAATEGGASEAKVLTSLTDDVEEVTWLPRVAGG